MTPVSIVVPTLGRPSLPDLLAALPSFTGELILVDDRRRPSEPLPVPPPLTGITRELPGRGCGPAAARNVGWRAAECDWVVFLDDDVVPDDDWLAWLGKDLAVPSEVGAVQGRVRVPLPVDRRPTDWERTTAGLAGAAWITADIAYRREALQRVGGFDERFPRAYREDAELAYRVRRDGWQLRWGQRTVTHPVRPESRWVSLRAQRGNADDAYLRRLYGPQWRSRLGIPVGRRRRHAAITVAGVGAAVAGTIGARRTAGLLALAWLAGTTEFAAARIAPGPRTRDEILTMLLTSAAIPPLATAHWIRGWLSR
jgi:glycosyltransferase involved in cell wall biosynthesis